MARSFLQIYRNFYLPALLLLLVLSSCRSSKPTFNPQRKFSAGQLQQDYDLLRSMLEERHPGLYWYASKHAMDSIFDAGRASIADSATEPHFRKIITRVVAAIQCGHTSVKPSKAYQKYLDALPDKPGFPFTIKSWNDTIVVVAALNRYNVIKRGDQIDSLNGVPAKQLLDSLFNFIPADGNNAIAKNQRLSTDTGFGSLYTSVYGWPRQISIAYKDSLHAARRLLMVAPAPVKKDSLPQTAPKQAVRRDRKSRAQRIREQRSLQLHRTENYALLQVNSFSGIGGFKPFIKRAFRALKDSGIGNLVIDLRLNGGGRIDNSAYLTRFITDTAFKTGDSIYAITARSRYSRYIRKDIFRKLFIRFATGYRDGRYHLRGLENRYYQPKKRYHFTGKVYLLTGGLTYSASTLVLSAVKGQQHITIVGEPSGGAAYGNTAMMIPDVILPNTRVRFRLPLFRLVINKNLPRNGAGVQPDVFAGPSIEAIRNGKDYKMEKVMELMKR